MPILTFQIALLLPKLQSLAKRNTIGRYLHCLDHRAGIVGLVKLLFKYSFSDEDIYHKE